MIYSRLTAKFKKKEVFSLKTMAFVAFVSVTVFIIVFAQSVFKKQGWIQKDVIKSAITANISPTGFEFAWTDSISEGDRWIEWGDRVGVYTNKIYPIKKGDVYIVSFTGLEPQKEYFFRVRAGNYTLTHGKEVFFKVTTPKKEKQRPVSPAYGKIIATSGTSLSEVVLIYEIENKHPLMTVVKSSGEWLIPLSEVVSKKTNLLETVRDEEPIQIRILGQKESIARGRVVHTRPAVRLLQVNLFTRLDEEGGSSGGVLGEYTSSESSTQLQPQIIYPKERALVPGNTPLIRGVGVPGKEVSVLIKGPKLQYAYRAEINSKGEWIVQYPLALEQGTYTITATTVDKSNFPLSLNRIFTIIKSGEQVLGDATGSPTLAPTGNPIQPTSIPLSPTLQPTITPILPTYSMPTLIPTSPSTVLPTAIPNLGGGSNMFGVMSVVLILIGSIFVLAF